MMVNCGSEANSVGGTGYVPGGFMHRGRNATRLVEKRQPQRSRRERPKACSPAEPVPQARDLIAGPEVKLLKISRAGALIESDIRLYTGSHIWLRLNAGDATFLLKGRVLRSRASTEEGCAAHYESAVTFEDDFVLHHEALLEPRGRKPARGSRLQPAGEPRGAYSPLPLVPPAGGSGLNPTILSEALLSGQTGNDLRRILGIV